MFFHRKELIQPANVGTPDALFGTYLLAQFGDRVKTAEEASWRFPPCLACNHPGAPS